MNHSGKGQPRIPMPMDIMIAITVAAARSEAEVVAPHLLQLVGMRWSSFDKFC